MPRTVLGAWTLKWNLRLFLSVWNSRSIGNYRGRDDNEQLALTNSLNASKYPILMGSASIIPHFADKRIQGQQ